MSWITATNLYTLCARIKNIPAVAEGSATFESVDKVK